MKEERLSIRTKINQPTLHMTQKPFGEINTFTISVIQRRILWNKCNACQYHWRYQITNLGPVNLIINVCVGIFRDTSSFNVKYAM